MSSVRRILCPVDFTPVSDRELQLAMELASRFHAGLILQHNLSTGAALGVSWMHEQEHHGEVLAAEVATRRKLAEETSLHARLLVMGAHAAGWIERLLFASPSTSREILHRRSCPVWFVPAGAKH